MVLSEEETQEALLSLGFAGPRIKYAYEQTKSSTQTLEDVVAFLIAVEDDDPNNGFSTAHPASTPTPEPITLYKLVLVVNSSLNMSSGKIASQCSHATLAAVLAVGYPENPIVQQWRNQGEPIIVLQSGASSLKSFEEKGVENGLPVHMIRDAGRTEVEAGSATVLAIGPAPVASIDVVTRSLSLLK
ncbi:peptidyl-tRNA hydrolase PTH2-domain-containing protein [Obelidium mucronatum]|nr:peptidyl-tRNA hydrolase PTH2-domain-containing protein [Obelidium mucronatum]